MLNALNTNAQQLLKILSTFVLNLPSAHIVDLFGFSFTYRHHHHRRRRRLRRCHHCLCLIVWFLLPQK